MNRILLSLLLSTLYLGVQAQIPAGYYDSAENLGGDALKTALYNIIKGHTAYPYTSSTGTDVWDILKVTDKDPDNSDNVLLFYTGWSVFPGLQGQEDATGNWNREHVWCQSRGDFSTDVPGVGTDIHHLRAVDVSVNSARNNRWYANCSTPYLDGGVYTGCFSCGSDVEPNVWQPRDEVKGDAARMIFYMATRYEGENGELDLEIVDYFPPDDSKDPIFAYLPDLLAWNIEDPVSEEEILRNNIIYSDYQHNRNPFIDHPEWVECIWNNNCSGFWFTTFPVTNLNDRQEYSYTIAGKSTDIANLTLSGETIPAWLTFTSTLSASGEATATLVGSPDFTDIGTHPVSIKLTDGAEVLYQNFEIVVIDGNPIQFTSIPVTSSIVDEVYSYDISVSGDADATFAISEITLPSWLSLTNNVGATATLTGTPSVSDIGINSVEIQATDDTKKTITQSFDILVDAFSNTVIITQYHEGTGSYDKYIEITNIGENPVDLSSYHLGRWSTTGSPSGDYADGGALSGTMAAGETRVYKNSYAVDPAYAVSLAYAPTDATFINGDDPVALLRNGTDWDNRVDCIYSSVISPKWGLDVGFYRKDGITAGNTGESVLNGTGEWVKVTIAVVSAATSDMTEYLGTYTGVSQGVEKLTDNIRVYPNPVDNFLQIDSETKIVYGEILNITGSSVQNFYNFSKSEAVNVSGLKSGLYLLKLTDDNNQTSVRKFIKR